MKKIKVNLMETLLKKKLTISCAESLTGGLLASSFIDVSGASKVFKAGLITYMVETKQTELNIPKFILGKDAVNGETAALMAKNVSEKFDTDIGVSTTGIAEKYDERPPCAFYSIWLKKTAQSYVFFVEYPETISRKKVRKKVVKETIKSLIEILINE